MPRFRVLASIHDNSTPVMATQPDGQLVEKSVLNQGDEFDHPADLDKLFVNKFERIGATNLKSPLHDDMADHAGTVMDDPQHKPKRVPATSPGSEEQVANDEDEEMEVANKAENPLGKDVTGKFPKAKEADLKVFYREGGEDDEESQYYSIVDADRPEHPINEEPITSKKEVNKFLTGRGK